MLNKNLFSVDEKLVNLPKYHIDTSVFFKSNDKEETRFCERYLQKVGYNYRGVVSFPTLSEMFAFILSMENREEKYKLIQTIELTLDIRNIVLYSPKKIEIILIKIGEIDQRINSLDSHILACAIEDNARVFVTLDKDLLESQKLASKFNIKIRHPRDLL